MTDLLTDARRGELAAEVLANEVYQDAYARLETEITKTWRDAKDVETRERLHLMLGLLSKVRKVFDATVTSGKVASKALEMEQSRLQRFGRALTGH